MPCVERGMSQFWIAFASVFVVVGPLGAVPAFAALTRNRASAEVRSIARRATVVGAGVLALFTLFGTSLLDALGVSAPAFQVAGSTLLFLTALEMLRGKSPSCSGCGASDVEAARQREDIAIVPVAIPMLAGPGSMATVMSLVSADPSAGSVVAILGAIAATFLLAYPILRSATLIQRLVGTSVLTVVQRVLGLVLAALSIQTATVAIAQLSSAV
jgi:multiple antibiotic resistance protein